MVSSQSSALEERVGAMLQREHSKEPTARVAARLLPLVNNLVPHDEEQMVSKR